MGDRDEKPPVRRRGQWLAGGILLAVTLCWCVLAGRVIYYAGDDMIGFHPLLLLLLPYTACLTLAAVIAAAMRRQCLAALAAASIGVVCVLLSQGYRIGLWAWSRSLRQYDAVNQAAIRQATAIPEVTDSTLMESLWTDEAKALPVLEGFRWYCEQHHAAPGGRFRAFRYRGVVHVWVHKIRHGYRGVAFVSSPDDMARLRAGTQLVYENDVSIGGHWMIWRTPDS